MLTLRDYSPAMAQDIDEDTELEPTSPSIFFGAEDDEDLEDDEDIDSDEDDDDDIPEEEEEY